MMVLDSDVVDHAQAALAGAAFESAVFVPELFRSDAGEILSVALGHTIVRRESPPGALRREIWLIDTDTGSGIRMSAGRAVGVHGDVCVAEHIAPGDQPGLFERVVAAIPQATSAAHPMTATPVPPAIEAANGHSGHAADQLGRADVRSGIAYGYMRVPEDVPDEKVRRLENRMRAFAAARGLDLVCFFPEFDCGSRAAFCDLLRQLDCGQARNVIVPTLRHLSCNSRLQDLMLQALLFPVGDREGAEGDGNVFVLEFEDAAWEQVPGRRAGSDSGLVPATWTAS